MKRLFILSFARWVALVGVSVQLGCGDIPEPQVIGELGNGDFRYECVGQTDALCADGLPSVFPKAIAIGGQFALSYQPKEDGPIPLVVPAASEFIEKDIDAMTMKRAGWAAVIAQDVNSEVIDILHLKGKPIEDVFIRRAGTTLATLDLEVGERVTLTAVPVDDVNSVLAGSVTYAWSIDDDQVVQILSVTDDDAVLIEGRDNGTTVLRVTVADQDTLIAVEVQGGTDATSTSSESDGSETSSTSDDATDTSSSTSSSTESSTSDATSTETGSESDTGASDTQGSTETGNSTGSDATDDGSSSETGSESESATGTDGTDTSTDSGSESGSETGMAAAMNTRGGLR